MSIFLDKSRTILLAERLIGVENFPPGGRVRWDTGFLVPGATCGVAGIGKTGDPLPYREVTMSLAAHPHEPQRPIWLCRACARPWPCPIARTRLVIEYAADPVALHVYLGTVLQDAIDDLYRLNPQPGPDPAAMYARFLAWARPRRRMIGAYSPVVAGSAAPERPRWAVETMDVAPGDHLLEIGCGTGVAISLVRHRLVDGTITAIDRSASAIRQAERRNLRYVSTGRAVIRLGSLEDLGTLADSDLDRERFDKIFAVNVNLFRVRSPARELAIVKRLLKATGRPDPRPAARRRSVHLDGQLSSTRRPLTRIRSPMAKDASSSGRSASHSVRCGRFPRTKSARCPSGSGVGACS